MKREIIFRGKRVANDKWVEGDLIQIFYLKEQKYIRRGEVEYLIDNNTVGQFTGLRDKNGIKIFEGDLIICNGGKKPLAVTYHNGCWECIPIKKYPNVGADYKHRLEFDSEIEYEVVGNIYEESDKCLN